MPSAKDPRLHPLPPSPPGSDADLSGLSQLSQQLISSGFLSRPLPANAFSGSLDGQETVLKCIWALLGARQDDLAIRETLAARQKSLDYDVTRLQTMLARAEAAKATAEKEASAASSRANAAQTALATEQARHKTTRDDLTKSRNSERMVKTQSLYESRRRDQEMTALQRKLLKLTEAPSSSSASPISLISTMSVSGPRLVASRAGGGRDGEVVLLEESLAESERRRSDAVDESHALRKLVGACEGSVRKVVGDVLGGHASLASPILSDTGRPPVPAAAGGDRLVIIPAYDVTTAPIGLVTQRINTLLFALHDSASVNAATAASIREEHEAQVRGLNEVFESKEEDWDKKRKELEDQVGDYQRAAEEAEKVVEGWAQAGVPAASTDAANATTDEAESSILQRAAVLSAQRKARNARIASLVGSAVAASPGKSGVQARAALSREESRRKEVERMLGDLGSAPSSAASSSKAAQVSSDRPRKGRLSDESLVVETRTTSQPRKPSSGTRRDQLSPESSVPRRIRDATKQPSILSSIMSVTDDADTPPPAAQKAPTSKPRAPAPLSGIKARPASTGQANGLRNSSKENAVSKPTPSTTANGVEKKRVPSATADGGMFGKRTGLPSLANGGRTKA